MKKNMLFLFLFLLFPLMVYADSIIMECPNEINKSEIFTCKLSGVTDSNLNTINGVIKISDKLSLISFVPTDNWKNNGVKEEIKIQTEDSITGNFIIGYMTLKSGDEESNKIEINSIVFHDINDKTINVNSVTSDIKAITKIDEDNSETIPNPDNQVNMTENNYLSNINIGGYNIDFNRETLEYTLTIKEEKRLNIIPVSENVNSNIEIIGNDNLKNGSIIEIKVVSETGTDRSYIINIVKDEEEKKDYSIFFIIIIVILVIINIARLVVSLRKKNK